ncbi:hypothetical protein FPV67DRAFT_1663480 [Lyophyllum atratum]|nr:hypothetical protein FPV67DRAFT_1663480 [Lyophyllum atratum]
MPLQDSVTFSLYRAYVRQIRQLPLPYLRQFFRIKASDDIRAVLGSSNTALHRAKVKRVTKDLRNIQAASHGSAKAFAHILDLAYGRKGKLKWEIMKPILSDPNAQVPPRIIPSVEKSRPPIYSPEMKALLMSSCSRKTKPLSSKALASPPTLPSRADPSSEDARLLGPFSKRREVNIRWKYFSQEWKKVRPPLQVIVEDTSSGDGICNGSSHSNLIRAGIRGIGMQGYGVFEDVEAVVGPHNSSKPITHREQLSTVIDMDANIPALAKPRHPSRWLRRRYQQLLGRIPTLKYLRYTNKNGEVSSKYSVSLSPNASAPSLRFDPSRVPMVETVADQEWLGLAREKEERTNKIQYKNQ